jgi:hypothetical protein
MRRRFSMQSIKLLGVFAMAAIAGAQTVHQYMGREVVVYPPPGEDDGSGASPPAPAKVCVEGPPQEQCYSTPKGFGWNPGVEVVQFAQDKSALFFGAWTGGVSGRGAHYALLVPGAGKTLENILSGDVSLSNQSRTAFWNEPDASDAKIFVTADYLWGPGESHYEEHRYEISVYVLYGFYALVDRYVTSRWYDLDANNDVLGSERAEIVARLKKVLPGIRQRTQ